jgi:hypothetical protein
MVGFGVQLAPESVTIGLPGAKSPEEGDVSVVSSGHVSHRDGLLMDIHADVERARL